MFRNHQNQIFGSNLGSQYFPEKCITDLPQCEEQAFSMEACLLACSLRYGGPQHSPHHDDDHQDENIPAKLALLRH